MKIIQNLRWLLYYFHLKGIYKLMRTHLAYLYISFPFSWNIFFFSWFPQFPNWGFTYCLFNISFISWSNLYKYMVVNSSKTAVERFKFFISNSLSELFSILWTFVHFVNFCPFCELLTPNFACKFPLYRTKMKSGYLEYFSMFGKFTLLV